MPRYSTRRGGVKLGPGEILAYAKNKGYYAKPKPEPPMGPILDQQVRAAQAPQRAAIAEQRTRTIELAKALAELNRPVGAATNQAYQSAAQTLGGLAQGYTGAARGAAEAEAAAASAELARLGAPQAQIDQVAQVGQGASDFNYALGGAIPGGALAREGAGWAAAQNLLPAQALGVGQYAAMGLDKEERDLLLQAPELRRQLKGDLLAQRAAAEEAKLKQRAQTLYEAQYGLDVVKAGDDRAHDRATEAAARRRNQIAEKNYQIALRKHEKAVNDAAAEGREASAPLSKGRGFLVDKEGKPILDNNGKKIPFKTGATSAKQNQQIRADAMNEARELRGDPMESSDQYAEGKYVTAKGHKGFPDGTTNDPKKAKRDGGYTFQEAMNILVSTYGISRSKARAYLHAAGFKPSSAKAADKPRG